MADQGRVRRLHRSQWAREAEPPPPPPGIAVPAGSPFARSSAADGNASAPVRDAPSIGMPLTRSVQVLAVAWTAASATAAALAVRALGIHEPVATPRWNDARAPVEAAIVVSLAVGAALLAVLVVYSYRATHAISRHGVTGRRWTARWAAGGWFVPIANALVPWLVFRENERIARAAADGRPRMWMHTQLRVTSNAWWPLMALGCAYGAYGTTFVAVGELEPDLESKVRTGYEIVAGGYAAAALGALCLAVVVGRMSRLDAAAR